MRSPRLFALALALPIALPLYAQSIASDPATENTETVVLSPFSVSASAAGRYQAAESTSGSRVRVSLFDTTQSVSVVTRDLIEDISAGRTVDAAKYVAGVHESSLPNALDRTQIRGFQSDGSTLDGFNTVSFLNADPVVVDRIEVVKGPNAILAPQGVPGGTINLVSKKPLFQNRGMLSAQVGRYSSTRAELDVNHVVVPGQLSLRVLGAAQDADDYGDDNMHQSYVIMPMATYRFGSGAELTLQFRHSNALARNYLGLPISPYADSNGGTRLLETVRRDASIFGDDISRHQGEQLYRAFLTASFTDNFSMRLAVNATQSYSRYAQLNVGAHSNQVVTLDPLTGTWHWDGSTLNPTPLFPLGGYVDWQKRLYLNLRNDFAHELKREHWKATTVFGVAANFGRSDFHGRSFTLPSPQRLDQYVWAPYTFTTSRGRNRSWARDWQVYLNESLNLFDDRLILNAGLTRNWLFAGGHEKETGNRAANRPSTWLPAAGLNVKITPTLAVYYGFSKQSTAISPDLNNPGPIDRQTSQQHEVGLRVRALEGRLQASLAYFDIEQNNFSIPNPLNNAVPPPVPLFPPLYSDRVADGIELEIIYSITPSLSLIASGTVMKNRDPDNVPFRNVAEKSGAAWLNYSFDKTSAFAGLSIGIGADYLGKRAGDNAGSVTSASTPTNVIRIQPSFWLKERTIVNMSASYRFNETWKAQLNIDNLLDEDYIHTSLSRTMVYPGLPINAKLTLTYNF